MFRSVFSALLACSVVLSAPAISATYSASGTVSLLRSHDSTLGGLDWFALTNLSSLGTCGVYNGMVIVRFNDDDRGWRQFAMVLAARTKNSTLTVTIDDSKKDSYGYCLLQYLDY